MSTPTLRHMLNGSCGRSSRYSLNAASVRSHGRRGVTTPGTGASPRWLVRFDGGSRGNPGPSGSGAVIYSLTPTGNVKEEVWYASSYLGHGFTSNQAEYAGLLSGLRQAVKMNAMRVMIQGDSQLVIRQLQKRYQVKSSNLIGLYMEATQLLKNVHDATFEHIPREENARADELARAAMDTRSSFASSLLEKPP